MSVELILIGAMTGAIVALCHRVGSLRIDVRYWRGMAELREKHIAELEAMNREGVEFRRAHAVRLGLLSAAKPRHEVN